MCSPCEDVCASIELALAAKLGEVYSLVHTDAHSQDSYRCARYSRFGLRRRGHHWNKNVRVHVCLRCIQDLRKIHYSPVVFHDSAFIIQQSRFTITDSCFPTPLVSFVIQHVPLMTHHLSILCTCTNNMWCCHVLGGGVDVVRSVK